MSENKLPHTFTTFLSPKHEEKVPADVFFIVSGTYLSVISLMYRSHQEGRRSICFHNNKKQKQSSKEFKRENTLGKVQENLDKISKLMAL